MPDHEILQALADWNDWNRPEWISLDGSWGLITDSAPINFRPLKNVAMQDLTPIFS